MSGAVSCTLTTLSLLLRFLGSPSVQHRSRHHGDSGRGTPGYTSSAPTMVLSSKALTSSPSQGCCPPIYRTDQEESTSCLRKNTNDADAHCSILLLPWLLRQCFSGVPSLRRVPWRSGERLCSLLSACGVQRIIKDFKPTVPFDPHHPSRAWSLNSYTSL